MAVEEMIKAYKNWGEAYLCKKDAVKFWWMPNAGLGNER